jgi:hypothetical protein
MTALSTVRLLVRGPISIFFTKMVEIVYIHGDVSFVVFAGFTSNDGLWGWSPLASPATVVSLSPSSLRGMVADGRSKLMMRAGGGCRRWLLRQIQSLESSQEEEGGTLLASRFAMGGLKCQDARKTNFGDFIL